MNRLCVLGLVLFVASHALAGAAEQVGAACESAVLFAPKDLAQRLLDRARRAGGGKAAVFFDLDDTVFSNPSRFLRIAREFDAKHGTSYFNDLDSHAFHLKEADQWLVPYLARHGLDDAAAGRVLEALNVHVHEAYLDLRSRLYDDPIPETVAILRELQDAGVPLIAVTARNHWHEEVTDESLRRIGLKPVRVEYHDGEIRERFPTAWDYKVATLRRYASEYRLLAFFEDRLNIVEAIRAAAIPGLDVVHVRHGRDRNQLDLIPGF